MNIPTVPASMANALFGFAVDRGASPEALLDASSLTNAALTASDGRVSLERYMALMRSAEVQCADPALALHFAQSVSAMEMSVVCLIGSTCETMADAVAHLNRYCRLTLDVASKHGGDPFIQEHTPDGVWLIDDRLYPPHCHQLTACALLRKVVGTRQLTPKRFVRAVHFVETQPLPGADYDALFGAPVHFGRARNALLMDPAWFALRVRVSPAYVSPILIEHADRLLRALSDTQSTRGRVASVIAEHLAHDGADMTSVARHLAVRSRHALSCAAAGGHHLRPDSRRSAPRPRHASSLDDRAYGTAGRTRDGVFRAGGVLSRIQALDSEKRRLAIARCAE